MGRFVEATTVAQDGARLVAELDPEWFIWGPFGGYLGALALRAMGTHGTHRRPATFSCQYLNTGKPGPVEIEIDTLKSGRRAECIRATIFQAGKPLIATQAWLVAEDLPGLSHVHAAMPATEAPAALRPLGRWYGHGPEADSPIWRHVERRPLPGFDPREPGPGAPEWASWLRFTEPIPSGEPLLQAARAIMWMDMAPWNAVLMSHEWPLTHLGPTLELTVQFPAGLYAAEVTASDWLLVTVESPTAGEGLIGANTKLWSESGRLVAVGTAQMLCVPNPRYVSQLESARRRQAHPTGAVTGPHSRHDCS